MSINDDYYKPGDWNAICDRCGRKVKASTMRKTWDGLQVCTARGCFETRQPQDFARGVVEKPTPPWTRPVPEPLSVFFCTYNGSSAVPNYAIPGCIVPGYVFPAFDPSIILL